MRGHIAAGRLSPGALDQSGSSCRIRSRATVVRIVNLPQGGVEVVYDKDGRLHKASATSAALGIGAWIAKHIVQDLPTAHRAA